MIRSKFNLTGLLRRHRRVKRAVKPSREEVVKVIGKGIVSQLVSTDHRETNRYVNGWAQAGNAAGVGRFQVRPLRPAKLLSVIEKKLRKQHARYQKAVEIWTAILNRYREEDAKRKRSGPKWGRQRRDRWVIDAERTLARAQKSLEQTERELKKFEGRTTDAVIVFNLRGGGRKVTIRPKVYGGAGRIYTRGFTTFVELHNKEAHASLVESRFKLVARANAIWLGSGAKAGIGKRFRSQMNHLADLREIASRPG